MSNLTGKTALVTGAGRGIGRAIALGLARSGANVVVASRTSAELDQVVAEIEKLGARGLAAAGDVSRPDAVERTVQAALSRFGTIDILVNNAGINVPGRLGDQPPEDWWTSISTCLGGTYEYSRRVVPPMATRGWGRVVNIASRAAKVGQLYSTAYCAAKHAVLGFTRALALEVASRGVTVNAVCPGLVSISDPYWSRMSELTGVPAATLRSNAIEACPQKSQLTPEDVVGAVLFLVSDSAARITGEAVNVSGGLVMH